MSARLSSAISALVAALVPIADAAFHWHLTADEVWPIVAALLGLGALELGHKWVAKLPQGFGTDVAAILKGVADALAAREPAAASSQKGAAP